MKKPSTCISHKCEGGNHCAICISRSDIAYHGYYLSQAIENCGCSSELTKALNMANDLVKMAEEQCKNCGIKKQRNRFAAALGARR